MIFGIAFHLILMHFYFLYSMLWGVFSKIRLCFQKNVFPDFRLIQTVFRSIKISFKNLGELLSISIDWNCFSINQISWIGFFKNGSWLFQKHFFKSFLNFLSLSLSLSPIQTWLHLSFFSFLIIFLQCFSLHILVRPFYPSFCLYFHISCIFMHF